MEAIDIVLLVLLGIGTYRGFSTGLLLQLVSFLSFFLAIIGGFYLMDWGNDLLSRFITGYENIIPVLSFVFIFFSIIILTNLVGKAVKSFLDMTLLGSLDNVAGALIGLFKWAFVLSILIWIMGSFGLLPTEDFEKEAKLYPLISSLAPFVIEWIYLLFPSFQEMMDNRDSLPQA